MLELDLKKDVTLRLNDTLRVLLTAFQLFAKLLINVLSNFISHSLRFKVKVTYSKKSTREKVVCLYELIIHIIKTEK